MALSPEFRSGIETSAVYSHGIIAPETSHRIISVRESDLAFNPRLITPEAFQKLDGYMQQTALLFLLEGKDLAKMNDLRPDFNVLNPLGKDELAMSFLISEITKRKDPITSPLSYSPDSLFAQIYSLGYPIGKNELAAKLERERQRAKFEFPGSLFAPSENIGPSSPARRYLGNLSLALERRERDDFRPWEPRNIDTNSKEQEERNRRQQEAFDAYVFENDLRGTF